MIFGFHKEELTGMKKQLRITLKSDLCAAVGKHYAAMIDLDTALDEYGIPYIPSRRLKGCLKETAEMFMDSNSVNDIFGETGLSESGSLHIGDAHIENYESIINDINKNNISAEKVTELFCSVRGETAIENDTAKENSLRYIRVVNINSPFNEKPLEFFADIEYDNNHEDILKKCVNALRNIGYHRNRGLGAVKCDFVDKKAQSFCPVKKHCYDCDELRITVKLESDLMLPGNNASHTDDCITGTMLLGAIAGKYIKTYGENDFNDIFFSDIIFSNFYPAVADSTSEHTVFDYTVPAPRYLAKIKAAKENERGIYNIIDNNADKQFKVLKNGYISEKFGHIKPETKIVYHNGNMNTAEAGLYMQYCLSAGQYFSGTISAPKDKMKKIVDLFYENDSFNDTLRFGRSKTAQYSRCRIVEFKPAENENKKLYSSDCIAAYRFESDVLLINEQGTISTNIKDICKKLGIDFNSLKKETAIATKIISGYNSKWNMKKPQFPVISAGSVIVFNMKNDDKQIDEIQYIGEKQNEGFGKIRLVLNAETDNVKSDKPNTKTDDVDDESVISRLIDKNKKLDEMVELGIENAKKIKLDPSQIGRITLMLKDADKSGSDKFSDFQERIKSIKTVKIKEEVLKHFQEETLVKIIPSKDWECVYKYIITALTVKKYQLRKESKNND